MRIKGNPDHNGLSDIEIKEEHRPTHYVPDELHCIYVSKGFANIRLQRNECAAVAAILKRFAETGSIEENGES